MKLIQFQNIQINQEINGRRLLHYAADYGQSEVVKYLISRGADVNVNLEYYFSLTTKINQIIILFLRHWTNME
jgi:ankyrin repeat protein